jgi:hypothetical protein
MAARQDRVLHCICSFVVHAAVGNSKRTSVARVEMLAGGLGLTPCRIIMTIHNLSEEERGSESPHTFPRLEIACAWYSK